MFQTILQNIFFLMLKEKNVQLLVMFGFFYRLIFVLIYCNVTLFPDSEGYITLSQYLLNFDLSGYDGTRSLGYPFLIFLSAGSTKFVLIFQHILGIITSIFWYKILLKLQFSLKTALYITIFLESFLHVFFYETAILTEAFTLFFVSLLFLELASGFLDKKNWKIDALVGLLLGYLVLIKPFYVFLPFVIYGLSILKQFNFKRIITQKIIILIFPVFAYFGWSYVNKINTGYFVSTTFFGLNLAQNCVYFAENTTPQYQWIGTIYAKYRQKNLKENETLKRNTFPKDLAMTIWDAQEELLSKRNNNFPILSQDLGRYAITTIKINKMRYAQQVICRSWFDFWKTEIYWNYDKFIIPFSNKAFLALWYIQSAILLTVKFSFLFLCPLYIFRFFKNKEISFEFIAVVIVFSTSVLQALVTFGNNSRFSYPFEFLMVIVVVSFLKAKYSKIK